MYMLALDRLDVEHVIKQYIFYISVFYSKNIDFDDAELNKRIKDLQSYINERISDKNV